MNEADIKLAARTIRLEAGGGSIMRWGKAFDQIIELFDPSFDGQRLSISQFEFQEALKSRRPEMAVSQVDREIDAIATHALRLVASWFEGNDVQERLSEGRLAEAIRHLEEGRKERRKEWARQPLLKFSDVIWPLSAPMTAALE